MGFLSNKIWVRIFLGHPVYIFFWRALDLGGFVGDIKVGYVEAFLAEVISP